MNCVPAHGTSCSPSLLLCWAHKRMGQECRLQQLPAVLPTRLLPAQLPAQQLTSLPGHAQPPWLLSLQSPPAAAVVLRGAALLAPLPHHSPRSVRTWKYLQHPSGGYALTYSEVQAACAHLIRAHTAAMRAHVPRCFASFTVVQRCMSRSPSTCDCANES